MAIPAEIAALVYDRTQGDVDRVKEYKRRMMTGGLSALTADEMTEYMAGMKGSYNYTDLNRVGEAVAVIAAEMVSVGTSLQAYKEENEVGDDPIFAPLDPDKVTVDPKTDWTMTDVPTKTQMARYISDIRTLYNNIPLPETTPLPPDTAEHLTWEKANAIEKILWDIWEAIPTVDAEQRSLVDGLVKNRIYPRGNWYQYTGFYAGEFQFKE